ncbi:uncharacterized protein LOC121389624 [Gigantopelta aegis]|uniref:uncharacterized protein LOC121389624 n=1 Tax=Gigantopelta aegis TaxID=1735272 RepID=UPI001B88A1B2|nr:uncharacterized protein LOC121389624 [Gigantopelta aegis]
MTSVPSCSYSDECTETGKSTLLVFEKGSSEWCSVYKYYFECMMAASSICSIDECLIQSRLTETREYCQEECLWDDLCTAYSVDCTNTTTTSQLDSTTTEQPSIQTSTPTMDSAIQSSTIDLKDVYGNSSKLNDDGAKSDSMMVQISWLYIAVLMNCVLFQYLE